MRLLSLLFKFVIYEQKKMLKKLLVDVQIKFQEILFRETSHFLVKVYRRQAEEAIFLG